MPPQCGAINGTVTGLDAASGECVPCADRACIECAADYTKCTQVGRSAAQRGAGSQGVPSAPCIRCRGGQCRRCRSACSSPANHASPPAACRSAPSGQRGPIATRCCPGISRPTQPASCEWGPKRAERCPRRRPGSRPALLAGAKSTKSPRPAPLLTLLQLRPRWRAGLRLQEGVQAGWQLCGAPGLDACTRAARVGTRHRQARQARCAAPARNLPAAPPIAAGMRPDIHSGGWRQVCAGENTQVARQRATCGRCDRTQWCPPSDACLADACCCPRCAVPRGMCVRRHQ